MPDIAALTAVFNGLKTATDIAKALRENSSALEKAELRSRLADLLNALSDTRIELSELQDTIKAKETRIVELSEALEAKETLVRAYDAYYSINAEGKPEGDPLCLRCWENDHRQRHLVRSAIGHQDRFCQVCKSTYEVRSTPRISPAK